jgi:histidyl-tRNA synthetase
MRESGLAVVLHCGGGSFKSQMKKADASRARYAAIIGDDEAAAGNLTFKALRSASATAGDEALKAGAQMKVDVERAIAIASSSGPDRFKATLRPTSKQGAE